MVAKLGGISAAADHLRMAKSGVSRHISQLEDHLGVKLLERGARSVKLTRVGETLDLRIQSILAEVEHLHDIANEESVGVTGQVTIAATPDFGEIIAATLFPALREAHPNLTVVMRPAYAFEDMQDPGTDIAFRIGSFEDDRLIARRLGSFRRTLVTSPEFAKANPIKHPKDLATIPCLTFRQDQPGATWTFTNKGKEQSVDVTGPIAVYDFGILLRLVAEGEGAALLPDFMVTDALNSGTLVAYLPNHLTKAFPVFLTFRPGARRIARIDAVLSKAEELVPKLLNS